MAASVKVSGGNRWENALKSYADAGKQVVKVGILEGATSSGEAGKAGLNLATLAAIHEFGTENIPTRSFMRSTLAKEGANWKNAIVIHLQKRSRGVEEALTAAGELASKDIMLTIEGNISPGLKKATIRRKERRGKAIPDLALVDTGAMQEAIGYEVTAND